MGGAGLPSVPHDGNDAGSALVHRRRPLAVSSLRGLPHIFRVRSEALCGRHYPVDVKREALGALGAWWRAHGNQRDPGRNFGRLVVPVVATKRTWVSDGLGGFGRDRDAGRDLWLVHGTGCATAPGVVVQTGVTIGASQPGTLQVIRLLNARGHFPGCCHSLLGFPSLWLLPTASGFSPTDCPTAGPKTSRNIRFTARPSASRYANLSASRGVSHTTSPTTTTTIL